MSTTTLEGVARPKLEMIPVEKLFIDDRTQRVLMNGHADSLVSNFDPLFLGVLIASHRPNGMASVLDGQHRLHAITRCGDEKEVACLVFYDLTLAQEAEIFLGYNTQGVVHRTQKFKVRLTAGDPAAERIAGILADYGVKPGTLVQEFSPIDTAVRICAWSEGELTFEHVVRTISEAWGERVSRGKPWHKSIVLGLARLIHRHDHQIDMKRLHKVLVELGSEGPAELLRRAKTWQGTTGWTLDHCVAQAVIALYNKGLSPQNELPLWTKNPSLEGVRTED